MQDEWQLDFKWLETRHKVKDLLHQEELPSMNGILYLIGIQELGQIPTNHSKEEKQDLMHVAICTLLEPDGYYEFKGKDEDNWPHFKQVKKIDVKGVKSQENLLKAKIIEYFSRI